MKKCPFCHTNEFAIVYKPLRQTIYECRNPDCINCEQDFKRVHESLVLLDDPSKLPACHLFIYSSQDEAERKADGKTFYYISKNRTYYVPMIMPGEVTK